MDEAEEMEKREFMKHQMKCQERQRERLAKVAGSDRQTRIEEVLFPLLKEFRDAYMRDACNNCYPLPYGPTLAAHSIMSRVDAALDGWQVVDAAKGKPALVDAFAAPESNVLFVRYSDGSLWFVIWDRGTDLENKPVWRKVCLPI